MWQHLQPASYASASSSRAASRIRVDAKQALKQVAAGSKQRAGRPGAIALIGLADDLGVRLNGGRAGAAHGPTAIRQAMCSYGVVDPDGFAWPTIIDLGDIVPASGSGEAALLATHDRIREVVTGVLEAGCFPIGLGGGHDLTLPLVSAVTRFARRTRTLLRMGGVYVDPHLDVRPTLGSGMPFRRLMEDDCVGPLVNIGASPLGNSVDHVSYFRAGSHPGNRVLSISEAHREMSTGTTGVLGAGRCSFFHTLHQPDAMFLSIDLDALDSSVMPAVSALNPSGLSMREVEGVITHVCQDERLMACDIMELCPVHDAGSRGARCAAHVLWTMISCLSPRFAITADGLT
jgi:formiminoglutamase